MDGCHHGVVERLMRNESVLVEEFDDVYRGLILFLRF